MNKHIKNWLDGMSQVLVLYSEQDYLLPKRGDFRKDAAALRGDAVKVTKGLRKHLDKNGKINTYLR